MADIRKSGKQYGLIHPKKMPLSAPKAINVFGNDNESEDEEGTDWVKKALKAEGEKNRVKKQTRLDIQKALREDPTICQYDEVFDDMKRDKEDGKTKKKEVKKAKYIDNLLKTADRRKREQEHRIERMVQKEREAEGAMYADKESFVTSAYRAKLEEFKKMEKDEENMDRLESIGDVIKQHDISGFYRHIFHQTVASEKSPKPGESERNKKLNSNEDTTEHGKNINMDKNDPSSSTSEQSSDYKDESQVKNSKISQKPLTSKKKRCQYRQRVVEASESESEIDEPKVNKENAKVTNDKNPIEEKITDDKEPATKKIKQYDDEKRLNKDNDKTVEKMLTEKSRLSGTEDILGEKREANENIKKINPVKEEEKKNKLSIWEKRMVGPVFEAALQRYYMRKADRLSGS